nr:MFS transporter [Paenibacillus aceris]
MQVINLGTFMTTLDVGIVNLALPVIAEENGVTLSAVQWAVTAYLLTMIGLLPILGSLSDRLNRGKVYSIGFLFFALGSLVATVPGGFALLLIARCIQGIGAAMIMANSQAMVRAIFPDHERGKALGVNTIVMSVGTLSGPAIGGFLMHLSGWPLLFWINVPIGLVAAILGWLWFPQTKRNRRSIDYVGAVVLAVCVLCLFIGAVFLEEDGFSGTVAVLGGAGLLTAIFLAWYERGQTNGIIDPIFFRNRSILIGNSSSFLYYAALTATQIPQAFYLKNSLGLSITSVGLVLAVQPVFLGIMGPLSGWSRDRFGAFWPTSVGALLCMGAMLPVMVGGLPSLADFLWFGGLFGAGGGLFLASNNADMMSAAPGTKASLVGSMLALIRYLGMVAGIAFAVLLVGSLGGADLSAQVPHLRVLYGLGALLCLAMLACGLLRRYRLGLRRKVQVEEA